jgi:hypothetical protein
VCLLLWLYLRLLLLSLHELLRVLLNESPLMMVLLNELFLLLWLNELR